ncbi:thymidine kinase [Oikeobacillus pervagus]|uniref:Thymidine kinase n=1 Tax=Oikeobacillus pervagus TaxID=1325931 RepID=A0AAJ1SYL8_9BACI|nr:YlbE-like family protein [Oikeobacillus pervagus]MDQ0215213.1 thymidine kinase [Oikeobacillus pervagus]
MRQDVMNYIRSKLELRQFLHQQPQWYRILSRHPEQLQQFEIQSMTFFERTIPQKVEKISNGLQWASMMMGMLQSFNQNTNTERTD